MKIQVIVFILFLLLVNSGHSQDVLVVTENWPPYSYQEGGEIKGLSTEIVAATLKHAKINATFKFLPWVRAYHKALNQKNVLIYTIIRNKERESLFHWVDSLFSAELYLFKLRKRNDITINTFEDIKHYRMGLMKDDATTQFFEEKGFIKDKHFILFPSGKSELAMLFNDRFDLIPANEITLSHKTREEGYAFSDLEKAFLLNKSDNYYFAFSKNSDLQIVERVRNSFSQIKENGVIEKIKMKYTK
jgi:polar amino acid transport system substrate-binding protein